MRKTIFVRYFIRTVVLLTVSMLALTAASVAGASRILSAQQEKKMHAAAQQVQAYMITRMTVQGFRVEFSEELRNVLQLMADLGDMHVRIGDADGAVVLDSGPLRSDIAMMAISVPLVINAVTPAGPGEMTVGYVQISSYHNTQLVREFVRNWILMSVIVVFLSGVTAYFSARRQTRPLRQMAACAHSFERGDFSSRADIGAFQDGEIHDLAQAFNGMAETLQRGEELRRGFIANISHELKTPMTTISGFIGGILDGTVPEEKHGETLQIVRDEIMRLSRLVESTADLSRLQAGQLELHPRSFDIAELSLRVLLGFEQRIEEKGLIVQLDVPEPDTLYVCADPDAITQVLTNLLDNALKFSMPGGELGLSIRPQAGKARVTVTNQGQAIPPQDLPYVFDRFYKADRSRSRDKTGLGLGLFLIKGILNAHNESIFAASAEGRTEFCFTLTEAKGSGIL